VPEVTKLRIALIGCLEPKLDLKTLMREVCYLPGAGVKLFKVTLGNYSTTFILNSLSGSKADG
jgi:hypothetical protein